MNGWKMRSEKKPKGSGNKRKWTHNNPKPMGHSKGSPEREVYSDTGLPKKNRNISNNQHNPTPTKTRGATSKITHSEYKEGNNQDQRRIKWHRE